MALFSGEVELQGRGRSSQERLSTIRAKPALGLRPGLSHVGTIRNSAR